MKLVFPSQEPFITNLDVQVNGNEILGWNQIVQVAHQDKENNFVVERDMKQIDLVSGGIEIIDWYNQMKPHVAAIVGEVSPGMSAYKAGLMERDEILEVDNIEISDWYEMREAITQNPNDTVKLKIKRNEQIFEKVLKLEENIYYNNKIIGISQLLPVKIHEKFSFFESIKYGAISTVNFVYMNYAMLIKLVANPGAIKSNIGGPVMMYTMSQQTVGKGADVILNLM